MFYLLKGDYSLVPYGASRLSGEGKRDSTRKQRLRSTGRWEGRKNLLTKHSMFGGVAPYLEGLTKSP